MPVKRCRADGKPGWKCGDAGKCYPYTAGSKTSEARAKQKAIDQCIAMGEPPGATVEHHNEVVQAGRVRADELEPRLAAAVEAVLDRVADEAARGFRRHVTDHLTASSRRHVVRVRQGGPENWPMNPVRAMVAAADPPDWSPPAADEVIDVDALVSTLRGKTDPVRRALIEAVMGTALRAHGIDWDATNPHTAKVLAQSGSQIVDIAETTQLNVMRIIRASYEAGLTIPDTAKAIREGMSAASVARSLLIARTELVGAVNGGSLAATQIVSDSMGVAGEGIFQKQWLTADGAVNPRHEEYEDLDGQTRELAEPFDVGGVELQFPGDPDGPPEEVCNCRCAIAYVEKEEG